MSAAEIGWRLSQRIRDVMFPLRPMTGSPLLSAERCLPDPWSLPTLVNRTEYTKAADRILEGEADLFGNWVRVGTPIDWNRDPFSGVQAPQINGSRLDYRDSRLVGSARNTWEINRHFQIVTLAQTWAMTQDERYRNGAYSMLASWVDRCPFPLGINWVSALEHGIRLINWYIAGRLLRLPLLDQSFRWFTDSIYDHCRFIWAHRSRYSSANNHLIGEMAGLYVASVAWPFWQRSAFWRSKAREILELETKRQVYADGVSKEQATGYQLFVIQFLLIAGLVGEANEEPYSQDYWCVIKKMLEFLSSIRTVNGSIPRFGDSDEGVVYLLSPSGRESLLTDLLDLGGVWSRPGSWSPDMVSTSLSWLAAGFRRPSNWPRGQMEQRTAFENGGYYVLGCHFGECDEVKITLDAGPLGYLAIAAHGHADCLSLTLTVSGMNVLIDPGTYTYHEDATWRDYFRGTSGHNTVAVDGLNQSEIGGPFMWLKKARASVSHFDFDSDPQMVRASHDGYARLNDPVTHSRQLMFLASKGTLHVDDEIEAKGAHTIERFWHFPPDSRVSKTSSGEVKILVGSIELNANFERETEVEVFEGSLEPRAGWFSPRFGELLPSTTLRLKNTTTGSAKLRTTFKWAAR